MKTIAVAAGVVAAATSLSVGAWAATGNAHPASKSAKAPVTRPKANAAAAPADARTSDVQPKSAPTGLVKGGQILKPGTFVRSPNEKYGLVQQTDGNLVLYQGKKALWSTATGRHPGAASVMQTDGNLVVYGKAKKVLWSSNTGRHAGAVLAVQNDGNLVIYSKAKKALWSRHISLGSLRAGYVLPEGQAVRSMNGAYTLQQQTDGNLVLYQGKKALWSTETGRHPGAYTAMQTDGNLVVYSKDKKALWYSNTGGHPGAGLNVQDDGNLVIYSTAKKALWSRHTAIGGLNAGQKLTEGNAVRSANGVYTLQQQTDGNLVLYKDGRTPIWSTSTQGANTYALMQADGNFVVYAGTKPLWGTSTTGHPGAYLAVQDDGNLVVYGKDKKVLWASRR
jgi:exopolysaccharide biosynthesis protein